MLNEKDYKAIAEIIKDAGNGVYYSCGCIREPMMLVSHFAPQIADYFTQNDLNFDRDKFLKGCGVAVYFVGE